MQRGAFVAFTVAFIFAMLTSCGNNANIPAPLAGQRFAFESFRDVPGITEEEIKAIEALKKEHRYFVYGMPLSTEAFLDENGEIRGFTTMFCEWLTKFFGIPFRPKLFEWLDLLAALENGEVSFSGELTATEERLKIYHMTSPIAIRPLKYFRIQGSRPLAEIARERPLRCGFIEGTATILTVSSELEAGTFEVVTLKDVSLVYDALKNGKIDAFYYSGTVEANFAEYIDLIAYYFYPLINRPVSLTTQTPALEPIISVVEKVLKNTGLRYFTELYIIGHQEFLKNKLVTQLTEEERAYINNNPVVPLVVDQGNYPITFFNTREREWQGIAIDVLREVELLTGIVFEIINDPHTEHSVLIRMLEEGEASIAAELFQTNEKEGRFLWPQNRIFTDYPALLSIMEFRNVRKSEVMLVRVGLIEGYNNAAMFRRWFPDHMNTVSYANTSAAFRALERGEIDLLMSTQNRLLLYTHFFEHAGYKANIIFDYPLQSTFGFNRNEAILCSIVDKALRLIDTEGISGQWMRRTFDYRLKLVEAQRPWLIGTSVLLLCLLILLLVFLARRHNEGRLLEALVQKRTAEAEAANQAKSIFLANMSHEIRTPMNSIIGFSELALDAEIPPKTRDYLDKITENAKWLLHIINDILDISKIESGKMNMEHIPFNLHEIFTHCQALIIPKAEEKGLSLYCYAEPSLGKALLGDPVRLRQALINILSNAVKFTKTGTIKLLASIVSMDDNNATIHFEVKDSGIGMSPEQVERIFQPFMQADDSITRKFGGTGLGLSITKNFIKMMGGNLKVESTPGLGSKFSFELKFDLIDKPTGTQAYKLIFNELEKPAFEGEVLICEDNDMNKQVVCEHLARVGLKTVVANDGKKGVDIVLKRLQKNEKPFDLIFMDIHMPVMDGLEAAAKITALGVKTPIVAMTANIMTNEMEMYKSSGIPDFLAKPFTSHELWECLLKYFQPIDVIKINESDQAEEDSKIQKQLKMVFVKNNQTTYAMIKKALEDMDIKLAHRLAHSLKSNAGQIGEKQLQEAAAVIEVMLEDSKDLTQKAPGNLHWVNRQMTLLETALKSTLDKLAPMLAETGAEIKTTPPNEEELLKLLDQLESMLKEKNPECISMLDDIRTIPGAEELVRLIEDFAFKEAANELSIIKKKLGIN